MRFFRRRIGERELDAEFRFHLDQAIAANMRAGMPPEEARREALIEFGAIEPAKERCRDLRPFARLDLFLSDMRYALRRMRRAPGFTAVAVLSLALGIGANTALFSLMNAALLRLIPVSRPEELVWFTVKEPQGETRQLNRPFYESLRGDARFAGLLCAFPASVNAASNGGTTERVEAELVSGTYFATLGVRPYLGRLISPSDDHVRLGHPVVVASYAYWQSHLAADPKAIGRTLELNGSAYNLIGVGPPGFTGIEQGYPRSLFIPMQMKPQITPGWDGLDKPLIAWLWIVGRIRPEIDRNALGQEMDARLHAFQEPYVAADNRLTASQKEYIRHRRVYLEPLRDTVLDARVRRHLGTLIWIVAALLTLACANLAGLLLARGLERHREIGTRLALGASRARVVSQLLGESLLLALAGGAAGCVLGGVAAPALAAAFPLAGPGSRLDVHADPAVYAFTLGVSLIACVAFGLLPAWQSTHLELVPALKGASQGPRRRRLRHALLTGEVALVLVLLTVAGLFSLNLRRLLSYDVGFARRHLVLAEIEPVLNGYDEGRRLALYRRLDERLAAESRTPGSGIVQAALSNVAPMSPYYWTSLFLIDGRRTEKDLIPRAVAVGPEYFATMRIPVRRGRVPDAGDDRNAPHVAAISESLARRAFPGADPIGRRFSADLRKLAESTFEIVGVVADMDLSDPRRRNARECVYVPYRQWPFPPQAIYIQARLANADAAPAAVATIRRTIRDLDPRLAVYGTRTIETALDTMLAAERLAASLTGFFALVAALLAAIGVYGIVAREVAARTREIGLRLALGASPGSLLRGMTGETLVCAAIGMAIGAAALALVLPWLAPLMTDVRVTDPAIPAMATVFLAAVSAIAAILPGRRATRVDPAVALRWE